MKNCADHIFAGEICIKCGANDLKAVEFFDTSTRTSWPETWMITAKAIACRSYDPRLRVGAIIVPEDNTQILGLGYNGNFRGGPNVPDSEEPGQSGFIHAEVNALVKFDYNFPKKKHMYVTHSPCVMCSKLIINAEISRVVYEIEYRDTTGLDVMRSAGIEVLNLEDAIPLSQEQRR